MVKPLLEPADYIERRLLTGGALLFCSAVVVQLVQIPPPQLTTDLRLALWAAAVAIPPLVAVLWMYAAHEGVTIRYETNYAWGLLCLGSLATFICAISIFQHFSGAVALIFFTISVITLWCAMRENSYHIKINTPTNFPGSMEKQYDRNFWYDSLFVLFVTMLLPGIWLLARFIAQRYL